MALAAAAAAVLIGVIALGAVVLPDATADSQPSQSLEPATETTGTRLWQTRVEVTGDRSGTFEGSYTVGGDPEAGLYLDQMVFDGLNIFLDPDECPLTREALSLTRRTVLLAVDCDGITDVQGNHTLALEGVVAHPAFEVLPPPSSDTGGTLEVTGTREGEIVIDPIAWYVSAGAGPAAATILQDGNDDGFFGPPIGIGIDRQGQPRLDYVAVSTDFGSLNLNPDADDCTTDSEVLERISDTTERVALDIECDSLSSPDFSDTVSLEGRILLDRITVDSQD